MSILSESEKIQKMERLKKLQRLEELQALEKDSAPNPESEFDTAMANSPSKVGETLANAADLVGQGLGWMGSVGRGTAQGIGDLVTGKGQGSSLLDTLAGDAKSMGAYLKDSGVPDLGKVEAASASQAAIPFEDRKMMRAEAMPDKAVYNLPEFTGRDVLGGALDLIVDPSNYIPFGKLAAEGSSLAKIGAGAKKIYKAPLNTLSAAGELASAGINKAITKSTGMTPDVLENYLKDPNRFEDLASTYARDAGKKEYHNLAKNTLINERERLAKVGSARIQDMEETLLRGKQVPVKINAIRLAAKENPSLLRYLDEAEKSASQKGASGFDQRFKQSGTTLKGSTQDALPLQSQGSAAEIIRGQTPIEVNAPQMDLELPFKEGRQRNFGFDNDTYMQESASIKPGITPEKLTGLDVTYGDTVLYPDEQIQSGFNFSSTKPGYVEMDAADANKIKRSLQRMNKDYDNPLAQRPEKNIGRQAKVEAGSIQGSLEEIHPDVAGINREVGAGMDKQAELYKREDKPLSWLNSDAGDTAAARANIESPEIDKLSLDVRGLNSISKMENDDAWKNSLSRKAGRYAARGRQSYQQNIAPLLGIVKNPATEVMQKTDDLLDFIPRGAASKYLRKKEEK